MTKQEKLSLEAVRAVEDKIVALVETLTEYERATLYEYLHAQGMSLDKAYRERVKRSPN